MANTTVIWPSIQSLAVLTLELKILAPLRGSAEKTRTVHADQKNREENDETNGESRNEEQSVLADCIEKDSHLD